MFMEKVEILMLNVSVFEVKNFPQNYFINSNTLKAVLILFLIVILILKE